MLAISLGLRSDWIALRDREEKKWLKNSLFYTLNNSAAVN
jgi:hypothetical protein